jgi:hypothetical protein
MKRWTLQRAATPATLLAGLPRIKVLKQPGLLEFAPDLSGYSLQDESLVRFKGLGGEESEGSDAFQIEASDPREVDTNGSHSVIDEVLLQPLLKVGRGGLRQFTLELNDSLFALLARTPE